MQPIAGAGEVSQLARVTSEVVRDDRLGGKALRDAQQRGPRFVGPSEFVQGVTLVNPPLRLVGCRGSHGAGDFECLGPIAIAGQKSPAQLENHRMASRGGRDSVEFSTRLHRVAEFEPTFRRLREMTVRKIQLAHATHPLVWLGRLSKAVLPLPAFFWLCLSSGFGIAGWAAPAAKTVVELREQLQQTLAESEAPGALWGIQVTSQRSGDTWFATNASSRLIPASNAKLYTAALALDRLGADYRFVTSLRTSTQPDAKGELKGDLVLVGGGDPTRCGRLNGGKWENAFAPLVQAVRAAGIRRIAGNLVCDESRFRGPPYGSGWTWDDLAQSYGAATSALSAEDNVVKVVVQTGSRVGEKASVSFEPFSPGLTIQSSVTTGPTNSLAKLNLARLPGTTDLRVTGSVPAGGPPEILEASVPLPALWFGALFREALHREGIEIAGESRLITAADRARAPFDESIWHELAALPSPPAGDVIQAMMKPSENLYAQLLLLNVGADAELYPRDDEPSRPAAATTEESGLRELGWFLKRVGIPEGDVILEEGSGLSRKNLITPRATVRLLEYMTRHRWSAAWLASLPVGGVDGTLRYRFTHPPTQGNVRAKTGTLQHVSSLSGYLTNAVGEPVVFSILVNNDVTTRPNTTTRSAIDELVELVAQSEVK